MHENVLGVPVGQHPLVKRVMAGVFNSNPPKPRYTTTWDVGQVLDYIESLGPNTELSDKILAHKLAMLLALTTASRASEIQGLDLEFMSDKGNVIDFTLSKVTKTRKVGQRPLTISLVQFEAKPLLDVVECIRVYIRRTLPWRVNQTQHQLLLGTVSPHKPVVTSTISNWLKQLMAAAGIDVSHYTGHSTRSAATSKAKAAGCSVPEIVQQANWSNAKTFKRFYDRAESVEPRSHFANVVLQ